MNLKLLILLVSSSLLVAASAIFANALALSQHLYLPFSLSQFYPLIGVVAALIA